jgi:Sugar-transfer associated ATP-grasp
MGPATHSSQLTAKAPAAILECCGVLLLYYRALFTWIWFSDKGSSTFDAVTTRLFSGDARLAVHTYSLARTFATFNEPHYRCSSFGKDIFLNLRNLAFPGTGLTLSFFVVNKWVALFFLVVVFPLSALIGAVLLARSETEAGDGRKGATVARLFKEFLLQPTKHTWFPIWRLNSALASCSSSDWKDREKAREYDLEDKGLFLLAGDAAGVPVSPFLKGKAFDTIVVKHKAIEGGMGIAGFFKNFSCGGDWIVQPRLNNSKFIASLLPEDAPLSTLRVITASSKWMKDINGRRREDYDEEDGGDYQVFTVVFRAGLKGASTDHKSICFSVDSETGVIQEGISNLHWYQLGLKGVGRLGDSYGKVYECHPDTGKRITGQVIPGLKQSLQLVIDSHKRLLPHVPLVGWDVALVEGDEDMEEQKVALLEVNLSCNFFNGRHDHNKYLDFVIDNYRAMEKVRMGMVGTTTTARTTGTSAVPQKQQKNEDNNEGSLATTTSGSNGSYAVVDSSPTVDGVAPAPSPCAPAPSSSFLLVPSPLLKPIGRGRSAETPAPTSLPSTITAVTTTSSTTSGEQLLPPVPEASSNALSKGIESSAVLSRSLSSSPVAGAVVVVSSSRSSSPTTASPVPPPHLPPSSSSSSPSAASSFSSSASRSSSLLRAISGGSVALVGFEQSAVAAKVSPSPAELPLALRSGVSRASSSSNSSSSSRTGPLIRSLGPGATTSSVNEDDDDDELLDRPAPVPHVSSSSPSCACCCSPLPSLSPPHESSAGSASPLAPSSSQLSLQTTTMMAMSSSSSAVVSATASSTNGDNTPTNSSGFSLLLPSVEKSSFTLASASMLAVATAAAAGEEEDEEEGGRKGTGANKNTKSKNKKKSKNHA